MHLKNVWMSKHSWLKNFVLWIMIFNDQNLLALLIFILKRERERGGGEGERKRWRERERNETNILFIWIKQSFRNKDRRLQT